MVFPGFDDLSIAEEVVLATEATSAPSARKTTTARESLAPMDHWGWSQESRTQDGAARAALGEELARLAKELASARKALASAKEAHTVITMTFVAAALITVYVLLRRFLPQQPPSRSNERSDPGNLFRAEARATHLSPFWRARYALLALALLYTAKGVFDLALADRSHWTFAFTHTRALLIAHLSAAAPFLALSVAQLWLIPWVGDPALRPAEAASRRSVHRQVGWFAVGSGVLAAISAAVLSVDALEGTVVVFLPWSCLWLLSAVMTGARAWQQQWEAHRWWAKVLTQNGLAFVTGRVCITVCLALGASHAHTYYYSMVAAFLVGWARSVASAVGWGEVRRTQQREVRWEKLRVAARVIGAGSRARGGGEDILAARWAYEWRWWGYQRGGHCW